MEEIGKLKSGSALVPLLVGEKLSMKLFTWKIGKLKQNILENSFA